MPTRPAFGIDEWYHCYNRGVDKRLVYQDSADYERFLLALFTSGGEKPVQTSNLKNKRLADVILDSSFDRGNAIVEIGAYCLMPNHFHLVLKEIDKGGIARFMQKLCTGYTMYFNTKYERTGALFAGTFKSKIVDDDLYLKRLVAYVHLNPAKLFDSAWKNGDGNVSQIKNELIRYRYSSLPDFLKLQRLEKHLLGMTVFELYEELPSLEEMITDAHEYYQEYRG